MADEDKAAKAAVKDIIQNRTRLLTGTRDEIVRLLKEALSRIQTLLAGQPSDYQLWALPRLQAEIRQQLNAFGVDASATMATAAGRAWESGQGLIEKPLEAAGLSLAGRLPALDTGQLLAMRAFMTDRISDISLTAANAINSELGLVAIGAQAPGDAVGAITRILGEKARDRATTIVRTELGRVFSTAANARLQQAGEAVPGLKKQWRRSGKIHSRPAHDAADGHVVERDQPWIINGHKLMYPHDPKAPASETINCGCVMLPYMDEWKDAGVLLHPELKPFTAEEIAANPRKAELAGLNQNSPKPNMTDWKAKGLPPAKALRTMAGVSTAPPPLLKGAETVDGALDVLRGALGVEAGGKRSIATPAGNVTIDDAWLRHIVEKREAARERYAHWIVPALEQPTEVWLSPYGEGESRKRFVKLFRDGGKDMLVVVSLAKDDTLWNAIPMPTRSLDNQREGELLWRSYR